MKIIFYVVFLISISKIFSTYTPKSLLSYYNDNIDNLVQNVTKDDQYSLPNYIFIDTNNYIKDKDSLLHIQKKIYNSLSIHVIVGIIDEIDETETPNLAKFSDDFIKLFYNNINDLIYSSLTIILRVNKGEIWVNAGIRSQKIYDDAVMHKIFGGVGEKLEEKNLDDALYLLLNNVLNIDNIREQLKNDNLTIYIISIVVAFVVLVVLIILSTMYYKGKCFNRCYKKEHEIISERVYVQNLEYFLNIIDNDNTGSMQKKEILKNFCIICLEHFIEEVIPEQIKIEHISLNSSKRRKKPEIKSSWSFDNDNMSREKLDKSPIRELIHIKTDCDKNENN